MNELAQPAVRESMPVKLRVLREKILSLPVLRKNLASCNPARLFRAKTRDSSTPPS